MEGKMKDLVISVDKLAEKIYNGISKQPFYDWYNEDGDFEKFIQGAEDAKSKEEILEDIKKLFLIS